MKYVVDSSVLVKWVLPEPDSDKALRLRDDLRNAVHELLSPDFFTVEAAHALTRAERQVRIAAGQARVLLLDIWTVTLLSIWSAVRRRESPRPFVPVIDACLFVTPQYPADLFGNLSRTRRPRLEQPADHLPQLRHR